MKKLFFLFLFFFGIVLIPSVSAINYYTYNDSQIFATGTDAGFDKNNIKTNNSQFWFAQNAFDDIVISFADPKYVTQISLVSWAGPANGIFEYKVLYSNDNVTFKNIFNHTGFDNKVNSTITAPDNFTATTARFWKIEDISRDFADNKGVLDFLQFAGEDFLGNPRSTITTVDSFSGESLTDFNVTWTNQTATLQNSSSLGVASYYNISTIFNISIFKPNYFNKTLFNINITDNLSIESIISRGIINVTTQEAGFNITLTNGANGEIIDSNETGTKSGLLFLNGNQTSNITLTVEKDGFANYQTSWINDEYDRDLNIAIVEFPSILNITIYDEKTNTILDSPVTLQIISNDFSQNYSNTTGNIYADNLSSDEYELIYDSPDFFERRFYIDLPSNKFQNLRLYLLNSSLPDADLILYEVTDENGVSLDNVTVKALRFFVSENSFQTVEMSISDSNGGGGLRLEKNNPKYQFIVEDKGNVILNTIPAQIFQDTLLLRSDLSEDVIESLVAVIGMTSVVTFDNTTNNFNIVWNDPTGITEEVCFKVQKVSLRSTTTINSTCAFSPTGSITLGIGENKTGQYIGRATLETTTEFSPAILDELAVILESNISTIGGIAMIAVILLVLGLSLTLIFVTKSAIGGIMGALAGF